MTTTTGHCRHCDKECASKRIGWDHISWPNPQEERSLIEWNTGHCPACDEAERIADAIEDVEANLSALRNGDKWVTPEYRAGMLAAARIARGDT